VKIDPARCQPIRLVIFDVDGVLTDGRITITGNGLESKSFHVRDGLGLRLLRQAGIKVAFLTGRTSDAVAWRAAELEVDIIYQGVKDKTAPFDEMVIREGLSDDQVAVAGDDLVDLPLMRRAGLALAPADAVDEVRAAADYVCRQAGGRGAVREMVEFILKSQGRWDLVTADYT
jgi:3-deoxy-D-manno-octulosonate 8-phosphate phosphatase (KDO 8-P phosphatase)